MGTVEEQKRGDQREWGSGMEWGMGAWCCNNKRKILPVLGFPYVLALKWNQGLSSVHVPDAYISYSTIE